VTLRPHGLGFAETVGLAGAAPTLDALAAGAVEDRSLHAWGRECNRCHRVFAEETPVRRTVAGRWIHDVC
jgi:hypothetical protein